MSLISAIPERMRDDLFHELNEWYHSDEREIWMKTQEEQAAKRSKRIALLNGHEYEQAKIPELLTTA